MFSNKKTGVELRPPPTSNIIINIPWEQFDKLKCNDLIPFECFGCCSVHYKIKSQIIAALKKKQNFIFCSKDCTNIIKKAIGLSNTPKVEELETLLNADKTVKEIAEFYSTSYKIVESWLLKLDLIPSFSKFRNKEKNRRRQADSMRKYLLEHPESQFWKFQSKSIPCEKIKQQLKERNVNFREEVRVLLHLGYLYSGDIVFEEQGAIIEINGKQHYSGNKLTKYYQERHDRLVNAGWRVFEIPIENAMKKDFLDKILPTIFDSSLKISPDLEYKKLTVIHKCQCGNIINKKAQKCWNCWKIKMRACPVTKEIFHWLIWNVDYHTLKKHFKCSFELIKTWIQQFGFKDYPKTDYRTKIRHGIITDYQI